MNKARREVYTCPHCDYKTANFASIGGHIAGCRNRHRAKGAEIRTEPKETFNPAEVAAELLSRVVEIINQKENFFNQLKACREQILQLEAELKKAKEERDRAIRIHNEIQRQSSVRLPTVESVAAALRRQHVAGKPL